MDIKIFILNSRLERKMADEEGKQMPDLNKSLKEGERILTNGNWKKERTLTRSSCLNSIRFLRLLPLQQSFVVAASVAPTSIVTDSSLFLAPEQEEKWVERKMADEEGKQMADLNKSLKEGERILAPTRRPDGTLRKPIRIRAGYVPQDEVAIYQSKGALWKKEMSSQVGPPGYDPSLDAKPKTKSVKRNERKKEKRLQAAIEKEKIAEPSVSKDSTEKDVPVDNSESVNSLTTRMGEIAVTLESVEDSAQMDRPGQDIDKRIRALKKKIRLTEALQQKTAEQDLKPEQLGKLEKLEDWRKELKLLEDEKAGTTA
ncbi:hypothetical protein RJT34_04634 [Clitoria ternatea]|uniref:WIBG Mago-binding domain-containing protein n=1 Tax=Clitoria ternatea TaxID=43366 RepID=A0AAN9KN36_CLITE